MRMDEEEAEEEEEEKEEDDEQKQEREEKDSSPLHYLMVTPPPKAPTSPILSFVLIHVILKEIFIFYLPPSLFYLSLDKIYLLKSM